MIHSHFKYNMLFSKKQKQITLDKYVPLIVKWRVQASVLD